MSSTVQFVDSIAASPTVRLDLNNRLTGLVVGVDGIDMTPPPLRRAVTSTLLTDGERIAAGAYGNRTIGLPLELAATTTEQAATLLQGLAQELDRPQNILKVQLQGMTSPVFFRTYRAPDYALTMRRLLVDKTSSRLEIPAEPFAYGLLETPISAVTLNRDPAAGSNPEYVEVTGVKGDVETPALIKFTDSAVGQKAVFAVRRRGTPANAPYLFQAEAMTQGTDTTTQPNDVNFSGAGNNYSRCTFATASMQTRLSVTDIGTSSTDLRGRYHGWLRYRKNTSGDSITMQLQWGSTTGDVTTNALFTTPATTNICTADLGEIQIPRGWDPVFDGRSGVELVVTDAFKLGVQAQRVSGAGTLDMDFLLLVPADDRYATVMFNERASDHWWFDAEDNTANSRTSLGNLASVTPPAISGGFPMLSPGQTNRVFMLSQVAAGATTLLNSQTVSVAYYPRYLYIRPAST